MHIQQEILLDLNPTNIASRKNRHVRYKSSSLPSPLRNKPRGYKSPGGFNPKRDIQRLSVCLLDVTNCHAIHACLSCTCLHRVNRNVFETSHMHC